MKLQSAALAAALGKVALVAALAASPAEAHPETARYCANASILGVERDKVCSITDTGVNYLSCVSATPFFGTVSCYAKYAAVVGIDYRYCDAGEQGCVN